jgi:hypothetical protein
VHGIGSLSGLYPTCTEVDSEVDRTCSDIEINPPTHWASEIVLHKTISDPFHTYILFFDTAHPLIVLPVAVSLYHKTPETPHPDELVEIEEDEDCELEEELTELVDIDELLVEMLDEEDEEDDCSSGVR